MKNQKKRMTINCKPTPIASAVALALLVGVPAQAQEGGASQLATVVVSANKRVEKLENVPMAISVVNEAVIERTNIREIEDLVANTPALTVTAGSTSANNTISMRGIGTSTVTIGIEADVAIIVDDIPIAQQFQAFKDLSDVMRVEVLKGPQSTLFGKSAVAGAVNIITKPISGPLAGKGSAYLTSDGEWRYALSYGGKVSDTLGLRVAASRTRFEGNLNNLTTGGKLNGSGGKTLMAKLAWHPTPNLDIQFSPTYNAQENTRGANALRRLTVNSPGGPVAVGKNGENPVNPLYLIAAGAPTPANPTSLNAIPASLALAGITPGEYNRDVRRDFPTGMSSTDRGAGLRIAYDLPNGATLMSITSFSHYKSNDYRDQDLSDVPTIALPGETQFSIGNSQGGMYDIKSSTQELRYVSPDEGSFRYVAGLWYAKNDTERFFTRGDCRIATCSGSSISSPVVYDTDVYNINKALFGQATWEFVPSWTLLAGARFNAEESGYHFGRNYNTTVTRETFVAGAPGKDYFESLGNKENKVTGKLSLSKQINPDWMVYATTATGYKGLAYGLLSTLTPASAAPVRSETSRTMELGVKANLLQNRMTVSANVFETRFFNYQSSSTYTIPGSPTILTQISSVPEVATRGVELDINTMVTRDFLLNAALAYTDAEVRDWDGGSCYNDALNVAAAPGATLAANGSIAGRNTACFPISPGAKTGVQNLKGAAMQSSPKVKVALNGQYDVRLPSRSFDLFVTGNYKYQSEMVTTITQDPAFHVPSFSITDIGFGLRDKRSRYKLSFLVNNVFDKAYATTGFAGTPTFRGAASAPVSTVANTGVATWVPARDAFRYVSVRLDAKF
ncbi:TonB-dependent receptor [Massilia glaciei]|uniref:TonB-dependent receptor n=1 Tax=Massilia glaciei TaxID=1524097 RepID=A0A2U2I6K5_9BURK|nr:TonB-dependent receptor [Massilia glaciei]PWF55269.1 TonB-dependent receptor [Massilia glaciei]